MEQVIKKYQKDLRCGITTGTCAAAAAKAAAEMLLLGTKLESVLVHTPKGVDVKVPVFCCTSQDGEQGNTSLEEFMVIKDSGDDPDVTNQAEIFGRVEISDVPFSCGIETFVDERFPGLYLCGGEGIGTVTQEGLEQKIGQPAINAVPRTMIFEAVQEVQERSEYEGFIKITIRIPKGIELAAKTFNPRLGIVGGISVLGTSGILEPMSERAIVDTIETQIRQLQVQGVRHLLVTPGNYGQGYVQKYLGMDLENSVKSSNYIGDTIDYAVSYGMETMLLVGNVGKLVKLAAGIMNTHSKVADARCEVFVTHTALCGGTTKQLEEIMESITTEDILIKLQEWNLLEPVMQRICNKIQEVMEHRIGGKMQFGVFIFSEKLGFVGKTSDADDVLEKLKASRN